MAAKPNFQNFVQQKREEGQLSSRRIKDQQDVFVSDDPVFDRPERTDRSHTSRYQAASLIGMKKEKLSYIHEMLVELRKLSLTLDEPMVAYLIEMALLETDTAINVGEFRDEFATKPTSGMD